MGLCLSIKPPAKKAPSKSSRRRPRRHRPEKLQLAGTKRVRVSQMRPPTPYPRDTHAGRGLVDSYLNTRRRHYDGQAQPALQTAVAVRMQGVQAPRVVEASERRPQPHMQCENRVHMHSERQADALLQRRVRRQNSEIATRGGRSITAKELRFVMPNKKRSNTGTRR